MKYNKTMIKIISVDDHEMISLGLERVFSETSDIRLCHLCKTKDEKLLIPINMRDGSLVCINFKAAE